MGLFGRKKPEPMGYASAMTPPPGYMGGMGIGDGMIERQQMGGYNQNAAMQGQSGFQGQSLPQKPKFFGEGGTGRAIAGTIGDFLMQNAGMAPVYQPTMQRRQDEESQFRYAGQKRQQDRENFLFEESYKRQNPMPVNNDTVNDLNWYKSLPEEDRKLYHQMKPVTGLRADGTPYAYNPYELNQPRPTGPRPGTIEDGHQFIGGDPSNPASWKPAGGRPGGASPFVQ